MLANKDHVRSDDTQDVDHLRRQAKLVAKGHEILERLLNPVEFEPAAQKVFKESDVAKQTLGRFFIQEEVYTTTWPDDDACPPSMRQIAVEEIGRPIDSKGKAVIAIPHSLLGSKTSMCAGLAVRFPGGGGITGKPFFVPWLYCADLEYAERRKMVVIDFTYSLMPEGNGATATSDIQSMWKWLLNDLSYVLNTISPQLAINWGSLYLFGVSWGGQMAIHFWLATPKQGNRPLDLCIKKILLRCPVTKEYRRKAGLYLGTHICQERAEKDSKRVLDVLEQMPWTIGRYGATPSHMMYGCPIFSIARRYSELWKAKFAYERLEETSVCPDIRTQWLIRHGNMDEHVSHEDSMATVEVLKKWPIDISLIIEEGKDHAWDSDEPLSEELRLFLDKPEV